MSNHVNIPALCLVLLAAAGCVPPVVKLARNEPHTVGRIALAPTTVNRLVIDARVGDIVVDSAVTDSLIVVAELRSHDEQRLAETCAPNSRLIEKRDGDLRLSIEQRSRNQCGERWTVKLPAGVAIHINGTVANVAVSASTPELRVRLDGPGSVKGRVNSPAVDVHVDIGSIELTSQRNDLRKATAVSSIGSVDMTVRGLKFPSIRRPPGELAEVEGQGVANLSVRSGNGKVKLIIE
jgi:hypothetical protein